MVDGGLGLGLRLGLGLGLRLGLRLGLQLLPVSLHANGADARVLGLDPRTSALHRQVHVHIFPHLARHHLDLVVGQGLVGDVLEARALQGAGRRAAPPIALVAALVVAVAVALVA